MSETEYSEQSFWDKLKSYALKAGREVVERALQLYYCAQDPGTPQWARTVIFSALAYFIMPFDAVADLLPGGYIDDLGALSGALLTVAAHLKDEHKEQAKQALQKWFGKNP